MKTLPLLLLAALLSGCAATTPPPTKPLTLIEQADDVIVGAHKAADRLNTWQRMHGADLKLNPALQQSLDQTKARLAAAIKNTGQRRDALLKTPNNQGAKTRLSSALDELHKTLDAAALFLASRSLNR